MLQSDNQVIISNMHNPFFNYILAATLAIVAILFIYKSVESWKAGNHYRDMIKRLKGE